MTNTLLDAPIRTGGRVLAKPPSIFRTGSHLPEVRWAGLALLLFLIAWPLQLTGAPAPVWWTIYLACYLAGGWEPAWAGISALRAKVLDVDLLMIVAAIAAASIGQVFDGALLIVIFATSGAIEALVTQRTADSVSSLLSLAPEQASRLTRSATGDKLVTVDTADLRVGDLILVRPGERIGGDGIVVEGISEVDQAAMTGESVPVRREPGHEVLSGTVNGTGALTVQITSPASESVIARMVSLVAEASETKPTRALFVEKVEQRYSLGVVIATVVVFALPLLLGEDFRDALLRAITFMIVASPCAVVLSTMPPLLAAIANAARHGILVKSATVMEAMGRTQLVAFDKTGTLTEGAPILVEVTPATGYDAQAVVNLAAAVEHHSEHPLGRAVVRAAQTPVTPATNFRAIPGQGVQGTVHGQIVRVVQAPRERTDTIGTVVEVLVDGKLAGTLTLEDALRPDAATAVARTAAITQHPVHLLTGDNQRTAADIAARTGITEVRSRLLPEDKAAIVRRLEGDGISVLIVGDGVNDAPALALASVGIAMGRHGSDLALETADAVIIRDELAAIPSVIELSRKAHRFVVANLVIAGTFIAVLVTWDLISTLPLPLAVAGHEGSTVIVALNGLRLLRTQAWHQAPTPSRPLEQMVTAPEDTPHA
ncbi:heavy metal translocating P-type ATPase [Cryobacterium sp. TMT1-66-1]|uniref:heavy metal translocating P-type ATPase n=1 Tax=Cryobacterium sp. TMT1-66-1 TaxID=1259242 RepID=UPI00106D3B01|nr:heavy metal translocating P-type ATPase [Cryobacterium sp. TMT1-66-1]TFD05602.1 cadmium-translocating P-type ATPase [Cryobacterium sp. TMT1-66-1]